MTTVAQFGWIKVVQRPKPLLGLADSLALLKVWNFQIGGYHVCEKWLKDHKGRTLSDEDIAHYHKIIVAMSETIRIMKEIDEVIEEQGGWPVAFQTASDTTSSPGEYKYDELTPRAAEGTLFED